jgi:hypothetical protein
MTPNRHAHRRCEKGPQPDAVHYCPPIIPVRLLQADSVAPSHCLLQRPGRVVLAPLKRVDRFTFRKQFFASRLSLELAGNNLVIADDKTNLS